MTKEEVRDVIITALVEKIERLEKQAKDDKETVDGLYRIFADKNARIRELEQRLIMSGLKPNGSEGE